MIEMPPYSYSAWGRDMTRLSLPGHHVAIQTRAATQGAETVLVIHGFPTCSYDWAWTWDALLPGHQLIAPDLLDYGRSENLSRAAATIMDQVDMIQQILSRRNITHCHIVAHDVGDTVAQEILARRQGNMLTFGLQSVVFLNGGMIPTLHRPRPIQTLLAGPFGGLIARMTGAQSMMKGLRGVCAPGTTFSPKVARALWHAVKGVNGKAALARRIRYMAERRTHMDRWVKALAQSDLPMMLINGLDDPVSGEHAIAGFQDAAPHADIVRLDGVGHFPQIEAPERVLKAVHAFHAKLGPRP